MYCIDCHDRAVMHPQLYRDVFQNQRGGGNVAWERLRLLREDIDAEEREEALKRLWRTCPGCDTLGYIPPDDYICEGCRNEGP